MSILFRSRSRSAVRLDFLFVLFLLGVMGSLSSCTHSVRREIAKAEPEVRAVWVSVLGPGITSPEEIERLVDSVRRANLNTIIAQVRRRGAVYFDSEIEPRGASIQDRPDFDPLAVLLKEAHDTSGGKARLDVHAWFNVFKIGSQDDLLESRPAPIRVAHPEWFTRDRSGEVRTDLDPGMPAVQDHIIAVIEECLSRYDVDGINLDFVRYFGQEQGYHPVALERFHRLTGRVEIPGPNDRAWSDFRRAQVTAFVRRCAVTVWKYRPQAHFTVDAVGFGSPPRKQFSDTRPYGEVFQDWAGWVREGYVDVVCRMGYKREWVPEQAQDFRGWADYTRQLQDQSSGRLLTLGIGGHFNPLEAVLAQYREALKRRLGTTLFSYHRPTREASETGRHGFQSLLWEALRREVYPKPAVPPRPVWRERRSAIAGFLKDSSGRDVDGGEVALAGTDLRGHSDGSGFFAFVDLDPGTYRIQAPGTSADGTNVRADTGKVTWVR